MIKYFMRKLGVNKVLDLDDESFDIYTKLMYPWHFIAYFSSTIFCNAYKILIAMLITFILVLVLDFIVIFKQLGGAYLIILVIIDILAISVLMITSYIMKMFNTFELKAPKEIFFRLFTKRGRAISKKDFELIKEWHPLLYDKMRNLETSGYCYAYCYHIFKILKKGYIEFIAIKNFHYNNKKDYSEEEKYEYTMHMIYVNNGWAFDTFSGRQWRIKKLYKNWKAKSYKGVTYEEIKEKEYDDFRMEYGGELGTWCKENDCLQFFEIK